MDLDALSRDFSFIVPIVVRWGDLDAFQHVNNVAYFRYFESARVAYFDATRIMPDPGLPAGVGPIIATASCRFRVPVNYPDTLHTGIRISARSHDRFTMEFAMLSEQLGVVAATGDGVVVAFDYPNTCKAPIPEAWLEAMTRIHGTLPPLTPHPRASVEP